MADVSTSMRYINNDMGFVTLQVGLAIDNEAPKRAESEGAAHSYKSRRVQHYEQNTVRFPVDYLSLDLDSTDADTAALYKIDIERRIGALVALYNDETKSNDEVAHSAIECASQCTKYAELLSFNGRFPEAFGLLEECDRVISESRDFSRFSERSKFEAALSMEHIARQKSSSEGANSSAVVLGRSSIINTPNPLPLSDVEPSREILNALSEHQQRLVLSGPDFVEAVSGIRRRMLFLAKEMELKRRQQLAATRQKERDEAERDKSAAARSGQTANALAATGAAGPEVARGSMSPAQRGLRQAQLQQAKHGDRFNRGGVSPTKPLGPTSIPIGLALAGSTASGMAPRNFYYRQYDPDVALKAVIRDSMTYNALVASSSSVAVRHRPHTLTNSQLAAVVSESMGQSTASAPSTTPNSLHLPIDGNTSTGAVNKASPLLRGLDDGPLLPLAANVPLPLLSTHHHRLSFVNSVHPNELLLEDMPPPPPPPRSRTICPVPPSFNVVEEPDPSTEYDRLRFEREQAVVAQRATFVARSTLIGCGSDLTPRQEDTLQAKLEEIERKRAIAVAAVEEEYLDRMANSERPQSPPCWSPQGNIDEVEDTTSPVVCVPRHDQTTEHSAAQSHTLARAGNAIVGVPDNIGVTFEQALEARVQHKAADRADKLRLAEDELNDAMRALDGVPQNTIACPSLHAAVRQRIFEKLSAKINSVKEPPISMLCSTPQMVGVANVTVLEDETSDAGSSIHSMPFRAGATATSGPSANTKRRESVNTSIPGSTSTQSPTSLSPANSGYFARRVSMAASPTGSMYTPRGGVGIHSGRTASQGTVFTSLAQLHTQRNWTKIQPSRLETVLALAIGVRRLQRAFRVYLSKKALQLRAANSQAKVQLDAKRLDALHVILMAMRSYIARKKAFIMHARVHYLSEQRIELELRGIGNSELNRDLRGMLSGDGSGDGGRRAASSGKDHTSGGEDSDSPKPRDGRKDGKHRTHRHHTPTSIGRAVSANGDTPLDSTSFASSSQAAYLGHNTSDESKGTSDNLRGPSGGHTLQEFRFGGSNSVRSSQAPYKGVAASHSRGPSTEAEPGQSKPKIHLKHMASSPKAFYIPFSKLNEPLKYARLLATQQKMAARRIATIWGEYREDAIVQSTIDAEIYMDHLTGRTPFPIIDDFSDYAAAALRDTLSKQELGILPHSARPPRDYSFYSLSPGIHPHHSFISEMKGGQLRTVNFGAGFGMPDQFGRQSKDTLVASKAPSFFGFSAVGFGGGYLGADNGAPRAQSSASLRLRSMSTSTRVIPLLSSQPSYTQQPLAAGKRALHRMPSTASTAFQTEGQNSNASSESQVPNTSKGAGTSLTYEYVQIPGVSEPMLIAKAKASEEQLLNPKPPANIVELVVDGGAAAIIRNGGQLRPPKPSSVANPRSQRYNKQTYQRSTEGRDGAEVLAPHSTSRFLPLVKVNISQVLREKEEEEAELAKWRQQELDRHQRLQSEQFAQRQKKVDALVLIQCCGRGYRRRLALLTTFVSRAYGEFWGAPQELVEGESGLDGVEGDSIRPTDNSLRPTALGATLGGPSAEPGDPFAASVFALSSIGRPIKMGGGSQAESIGNDHSPTVGLATRSQGKQQGFIAVLRESPHLAMSKPNIRQDYALPHEALLDITKMVYLRNPSVFPVAQARLQAQRAEATTLVQAMLRARESEVYCDIVKWRASAVIIQRAWRRRRTLGKP